MQDWTLLVVIEGIRRGSTRLSRNLPVGLIALPFTEQVGRSWLRLMKRAATEGGEVEGAVLPEHDLELVEDAAVRVRLPHLYERYLDDTEESYAGTEGLGFSIVSAEALDDLPTIEYETARYMATDILQVSGKGLGPFRPYWNSTDFYQPEIVEFMLSTATPRRRAELVLEYEATHWEAILKLFGGSLIRHRREGAEVVAVPAFEPQQRARLLESETRPIREWMIRNLGGDAKGRTV